MAACEWCEQEMTTASSCTISVFHVERQPVELITFGAESGLRTWQLRCGDCGVVRGGHHHLGCGVQRCPLCRGQMMTCGCRFDEDGPDEDDDEDERCR